MSQTRMMMMMETRKKRRRKPLPQGQRLRKSQRHVQPRGQQGSLVQAPPTSQPQAQRRNQLQAQQMRQVTTHPRNRLQAQRISLQQRTLQMFQRHHLRLRNLRWSLLAPQLRRSRLGFHLNHLQHQSLPAPQLPVHLARNQVR
jgi:hypothetical protein